MGTKFMMLTCPSCGSEFRYGPQVYEGKHIPRYQVTVCMICYEGNWDGWANIDWLMKHLKSMNLPIPKPNSKGWLPRD